MCSDEILPCARPTHQVRVLASGDHKVCIARDPPLPIRLLAEQSECIPGPTRFVAIRRGQHYFDAIAYESPLAKDLQFQDLASAFHFHLANALCGRSKRFLP